MRLFDSQGRVVGALGPVTPHGVVLHDGEALVCLEPWTGEVLWSRSDVPPGCELFGDEQLVFAKPPHQELLLVYDLMDGRSRGSRTLPEGEWLVTAGRHLATLERMSADHARITITDVWSQEELVERTYERGTQLCVHEPHALAVLQPAGQLEWIDVAAGRAAWEASLRAEPRLRRLYVHRDRSRLFVVTDRPAERQPETRVSVADTTYPLVTGYVYALDPDNGRALWEEPAAVVEEGLALHQPQDTPLLVFVSRVNMQQRGRGDSSRLRLLCLDKATGRTVVENDALEDGPGGRFQVGVKHGEQAAVVVEMPLADVRLTLTDQLLEAAEVEAADESTADNEVAPESALWKLGSQLGKQFLEALDTARRAESEPADDD
jgi:outer membrane protein assembly factor BamB